MFTQDYIMRMIEMLVQGIAKIMRLKQEKKYEECGEALTGTLRQFYGLNDLSVEQLPWADLMAVANLGGLPDSEKCILLAQLVREKADLVDINGDRELSALLYIKSFCIYASAVLSDPDFNTQTHRDNINALAAVAAQYKLPVDAIELLMKYYETAGRYAKAEDALWRLLEQTGVEETCALGRAYYKRLLEKSDAELMAGDLPRVEVLEGLGKLERQ